MQDSGISGIILIRMSIKVFHTASLVIVAFLAVSCVESINLDPMQEMPVVVTCVLTTETAEKSAFSGVSVERYEFLKSRLGHFRG